MSVVLSRKTYADLWSTAGDRVRLGDTNLVAEIERDFTTYGDECKFGGGKVLRDRMGQFAGADDADALDLVITNAIIIDWTGITEGDIGVKHGRIVGIRKAGNPAVMHGVGPGMIVGVTTEAIAAEGLIVTAGGIDTHIHFICPQQADEAIASGITTFVGGGTGPTAGTKATTCAPGARHIDSCCRRRTRCRSTSASPAGEHLDVERAHRSDPSRGDRAQAPRGLGHDADRDRLLPHRRRRRGHPGHDPHRRAEQSGYVSDSIAAFKGRTIHVPHRGGAGGGHARHRLRVAGEPNVIPSSTNPTLPYTRNTLDDTSAAARRYHHLDREIPEDVAFAESRIRPETIAAEDVLHDMGALSIVSSDSQAMGRVGEVITRALANSLTRCASAARCPPRRPAATTTASGATWRSTR
ncbi:MAG: amidohydrolase family protein [Polyangiaceae bacterium]